ncbi:MAG TPA: NAD(P)H-hydrate dehydratase, partial [Burkholderiaceae bacterium]|nr:NAD(P)H-hydrate dehydratase [Burkholderiaceae bacterium]
TFIGDKPGLHTCDGRDYAGQVTVARLDLDPARFNPVRLHLNEVDFFARHLRARRQNSHKGSYGNVAVVGGARGMAGAPILAARAALHAGAGRVFAVFADDAPAYDSVQPELMCRAAAGFDLDSALLVLGPGLGTAPQAVELLKRSLASGSALVADADALNLIGADPALQAAMAQRSGASIVTPHPLEAARLLGIPVGAVQADRVAAARKLAALLNATVVLKGSGSVIAAPGGHAVINTTGNPALATAGTGDVLAGLCGSLLAQGWPQWEAALAAVWLHGMAADVLVAEGTGPIGLSAGELVPAIRTAINRLVQQHAR